MKRLFTARGGAVLLVFLAFAGALAVGQLTGGNAAPPRVAARGVADTGWTVGELRPDGLRIVPSGRSDAAAVLDPEAFTGQVRHAYWVATQIPETLNQLYCWCGCENRGVHRSNLQCFEDDMGVNCAVCQGTAEIADRMVRQGITDAGRIQAAVDEEWGKA